MQNQREAGVFLCVVPRGSGFNVGGKKSGPGERGSSVLLSVLVLVLVLVLVFVGVDLGATAMQD